MKCQENKPFCHICHAGVCEYIYPVFRDTGVAGFISVSGYKQTRPVSAENFCQDLWEKALKPEIPFTLCEAVIPPLAIMLEQAIQVYFKKSKNEYNLILQYLTEYHTQISLNDLSKHFNRSKSHISHLFKRESGMTIRAYCNNQKLEDAKKLLIYTDIPITEIALDTGFCDTSYFIYLFKRKFGLSPLQYRKISKIKNADM